MARGKIASPWKLALALVLTLSAFVVLSLIRSPIVFSLPTAAVSIAPAEGDSIIIPTFSWQASGGSAFYEIQVGPQSDPNLVNWTATTQLLRLTPNQTLAHGLLYWRVRACSVSPCDGVWSSRINFTKYIPAPKLLSPHNHIALTEPTFEWGGVQGAAYYKIEVTTDPTFNSVPAGQTYTTYATRLTPNNTLPHGTFYWRVRGVDTGGHEGANSVAWSFVKRIPPPLLLSPADGVTVTVPILEWQVAEGAAYYKVDVTTDPTFNSVPAGQSYTTYNTRLVPNNTLAHGVFYWRVRGMDVDGHEGINSTAGLFYKHIPAPVLIGPANGVTVTVPMLEWQAAAGAAYYKVQITTDPTFNSVNKTYTTYQTRLIPNAALTAGAYYWRVLGVDADAHEGVPCAGRRLILAAPAAATDSTPQLQTPADGETVGIDPTFRWTRVIGAAHYHVYVSTSPTFVSNYDTVATDYTGYSPYTAGSRNTYVNGLYYWKVVAQNSAHTNIAESSVRNFTRQATVALADPADAALLDDDPDLQWVSVPGAHHYLLIVSTSPSFAANYDTITTDYTAYTPYAAGTRDVYVNGVYYWKVAAHDSASNVIATSEARRFAKQLPLPLTGPYNGATLLGDPTFDWARMLGINHYRLAVSTNPSFSTNYDTITTDYTRYTPYTAGVRDVYANATYYWKVTAHDSASNIIATSEAYRLTKTLAVPVFSPANGAALDTTPNFVWGQVTGANHYRLVVSTNPTFASTYDTVSIDYNTYSPYTAGTRDVYADGDYYWKVEVHDSGSNVIATSLVSTFAITSTGPTITPPTPLPTTPPPTTVTPTPVITSTPGITSTVLPPTVTPGPQITNKKTLGNVTVYADTFVDLGNAHRFSATGHIRLGTNSVPYAEIMSGTITLDYEAMSISGNSYSLITLLLDDGSATPLFAGPFSVDSNSGDLRASSAISQLGRLGDLAIDTGFPVANFVLNVLQGTASGRARFFIYPIEGTYPTALVNFTLYHAGHIGGGLGVNDLQFKAASLTFEIDSATFSYDATNGGKFVITRAAIDVPDALSFGLKGEVTDLVITRNGLQKLGGGTITLSLPDMSVPGTDGKFKLAASAVSLTLEGGGKYKVHGEAGFEMLGMIKAGGKLQESVGIYAEFDLDQAGLQYILMKGTLTPGIPIGQTGLALTGLQGSFDFSTLKVQVTGTIESELEVPPLGALISGEPSLWVQFAEPIGIGIEGSLKVLIFDAANAALSISEDRGLEGSVHINYLPYAIQGDASLHVWRAGGKFHFTGSAGVTLGFNKGALGTYWGIDLPPFDATFGNIAAQFGEFCGNQACDSTVYGFKGAVDLTIRVHIPFDGNINKNLFSYAFFIDTNGHLDYGSSLDRYRLIDQSAYRAEAVARGLRLDATNIITYAVTSTDLGLVGMSWQSGSPSLTLIDPDGITVTTDTAYPNMGYTTTVTSTVYLIDNPKVGTWQAVISNVTGSEQYSFGALGRNPPPTITAQSVVTTGANLFTLQWISQDVDPGANVALYYNAKDSDVAGTLITQGLSLSGSYLWDASQVKTGDYHLYARSDDRKNTPIVRYFTQTVSVNNTIAPAAPTGLQTSPTPRWLNLDVCWNRAPEADVVGYHVYYGRDAGIYDLGLYDAANSDCYRLPLPAWLNTGYVAVSAYDNSGNESQLTELPFTIDRRYRVYLPLARR